MQSDGIPAFELQTSGAGARFGLWPSANPHQTYLARIDGFGISAETEVCIGRARFSNLFGSLASDWRGWEGEREFSAQPPSRSYGNPTLRLTATADGRGHAKIVVEMGAPWLDPEPSEFATHVGFAAAGNPGEWVARICLEIESGQLDEVAARATQLPFDCLGHW